MDNEGWEPVPSEDTGWEPVTEDSSVNTTDIPYSKGQKGKDSLINRIPAANREVLRSIGTGEDKADAYMRGLNAPSKSETFQSEALRKYYDSNKRDDLSTSKKPYLSAAKNTAIEVGGLAVSAAGLATDIATNPKEAIAIALAERFPTLVKEVAPGIAGRVAEFANKERSLNPFKGGTLTKPGSADIANMVKEAKTETIEMSNQLFKQRQADMATVKSNYVQTKNGLDAKISTLDKESIPKAADNATLSLRKKYVPYAKDISDRFGVDYQKAIRGEKIQTQKLYNSLEEVVGESGIMSRPESSWSGSEKKIFDYYKKIESQLPSMESQTQVVMGPGGPQRVAVPTNDTLELAKVDKELNTILSSKSGSQYGSGDHILTITREKVANAIGDAVPRVKAVRMKYAPELQAKNELYKITQPFNRSGSLDTTKGINFFSEYATGNMSDPDKIRLIDHIKSSKTLGADLLDDLGALGRERNIYQINKLKLANDQMATSNSVKRKYLEADIALEKDKQNHLSMLEAMKQVAIAEESGLAFRHSLIKKAAQGAASAAGAGAVAGASYSVYEAIRK